MNQIKQAVLRPLNKGVDHTNAPQLLDATQFIDLKNVQIRESGLRRRGGYIPYLDQLPTIDHTMYGTPLFYDSSDGIESLLVTNKHLYKITDTALTLLSDVIYSSLSAVIATTGQQATVTVAGETFITDATVQVGDTIWIGGTSSGTPYEVVAVTSETVLTIVLHDGATYDDSYTVDVVAAFQNKPDWTLVNGNFVFCDDSPRKLQRYDGTDIDVYDATSGAPVIKDIETCVFFSDRLWIGGIEEGGTDELHRIRWTSVDTLDEFPSTNFLDLPYGRQGIRRLVPLGNLLVAYFGDRIYYGRPTNIVNLPYDFTVLNTGSIGLVGKHAVASWLDAHWFVGQDNIYSLSASRALEIIGTPIYEDTIGNPDVVLEDTIVRPDPTNERILFLFFDKNHVASRIWGFYYKTGEWASDVLNGSGVDYFRTVNETTWEDASGTWEDALYTWDVYTPIVSEDKLVFYRNRTLNLYQPNATGDGPTQSIGIGSVLESGDLDFGSPDLLKVVTRLALKLERPVNLEDGGVAYFRVHTSRNRGTSWVDRGIIRIEVGKDEGKVNFNSTGSLFRFRLTVENVVRPWKITEITLQANEIGYETP